MILLELWAIMFMKTVIFCWLAKWTGFLIKSWIAKLIFKSFHLWVKKEKKEKIASGWQGHTWIIYCSLLQPLPGGETGLIDLVCSAQSKQHKWRHWRAVKCRAVLCSTVIWRAALCSAVQCSVSSAVYFSAVHFSAVHTRICITFECFPVPRIYSVFMQTRHQ